MSIETDIKKQDEALLDKEDFVCDVKIPNKETVKAMKGARERKTHKTNNKCKLFEYWD